MIKGRIVFAGYSLNDEPAAASFPAQSGCRHAAMRKSNLRSYVEPKGRVVVGSDKLNCSRISGDPTRSHVRTYQASAKGSLSFAKVWRRCHRWRASYSKRVTIAGSDHHTNRGNPVTDKNIEHWAF